MRSNGTDEKDTQISNKELYSQTNTLSLSVNIRIQRWRWIGHIQADDNVKREQETMGWQSLGVIMMSARD